MPHRQPPAHPDWAVDALFELEDPLPGCFLKLVEAGPGEVTAKRPSRGRPRKHNQTTPRVR
jgi:hypothetical protein